MHVIFLGTLHAGVEPSRNLYEVEEVLRSYPSRQTAGACRGARPMGQWLAGRAQLSADQSAKTPRHGLFSQRPKVGEGRGCFFNFFPTEIERIQICSSEKLQICSSESFSVLMHALQAEFQEQLVKIKEHARQKDEEIEGGWYTEERLEKDLGWSKSFGPFFSPCFFSSLYCACCVFGMESGDWHSYVGKVTDWQSEIVLQSLQERALQAGDLLLSTPTPIDPKYFLQGMEVRFLDQRVLRDHGGHNQIEEK